jgi:hypothetical protein
LRESSHSRRGHERNETTAFKPGNAGAGCRFARVGCYIKSVTGLLGFATSKRRCPSKTDKNKAFTACNSTACNSHPQDEQHWQLPTSPGGRRFPWERLANAIGERARSMRRPNSVGGRRIGEPCQYAVQMQLMSRRMGEQRPDR